MLATLLAKDLRRARRNPVPYLVQLSVPLVITALLGIVFAGNSGSDSLGKIRVAIVDEDKSPLVGFLRGTLTQGDASKHIEPVFLPRDEALRQVTNNQVSAAVIIPARFTKDYLTGTNPVTLEIVKNPAEAYYPAIIEEGLRVLTTGLDGVKRNFHGSLGDWHSVLSGDRSPTMREITEIMQRTADRVDGLRQRSKLVPVWLKREEQGQAAAPAADAKPAAAKPSVLANMFAFLLPGLSAMFLLLLANVAMRDLVHETTVRTFQRYCSLVSNPGSFIAGKVVFTVVMVLAGAAILLGGGGLVFRIDWHDPWKIALTCVSYAIFAGGMLAFLTAVVSGRASEVLNNIVLLLLGLSSGCAFPSNVLPDFMRTYITPFLPPSWFIDAVRGIQFGGDNSSLWHGASLKLLVAGVVFALLSSWFFTNKLRANALN